MNKHPRSPSKRQPKASAPRKPGPDGTPPDAPLARAKARLGLSDALELSEALAAIRRALDQQWLFEAEVLARFVLLHRPENPDAWALRGEAALADQDPASARVYFHEALRCLDLRPAVEDLRRQRYTYWRGVAEANTRLNRRAEAEAALLQAARYDPDAKVETRSGEAASLLSRAYPLILQNQLDQAEPLIKAVLAADPANAAAWQGLAVLEHKRGRHEEALQAIDRALELNPQEAGFWNNRGVLLKPLGAPRNAERIAAYQRAVSLNPHFKEAYSNLADALMSEGRYDEAQAALEAALTLDPDYVGAAINRANLLKLQGKKKEALAAIDAVLEKTRHPEALNIKGAILLETGDAHQAVAVLEEARALDSRNASILNNLGNAYLATARPAKAIDGYRAAVLLAPGMAEAQANLALALLTQIQHGAPRGEYLALAKNHLAIAQSLNPKLPQLFIAEGILKSQHEHDRAAAQKAYEKAIELQPQSPQALSGLASLYADMGERKKARELLKRAYELAPDDTDIATGYIFALNYDPDSTPEEIYQAALSYGRQIQARVGEPYTDWPNARDPDKRLKVGFVSGDFRRHPVAYQVAGLLEALDRADFEVLAYSNHLSSDDMTARIKAAVDHWRVIADMSDEAVCDLIRADGIDILIDLSGHTGYNRLAVLAKKPVPIQCTYTGFHSGTGLSAVDYYIIDVEMTKGLESYYIESIANIDYAWNMDPRLLPLEARQADVPCSERGYVSVGSLNNPFKYNEKVISVFAEILKLNPVCVLSSRSKAFMDPAVSKSFSAKFEKLGVNPAQIICGGAMPRDEALAWLASNIDFGLDPFPYGGHTSAFESLCMGVPMLTLWGERVPGRVCSVFNKRLGLNQWVAKNISDYIEKASYFIENIDEVRKSRSHLISSVGGSMLLNKQDFASQFGNLLRSMWKRHSNTPNNMSEKRSDV